MEKKPKAQLKKSELGERVFTLLKKYSKKESCRETEIEGVNCIIANISDGKGGSYEELFIKIGYDSKGNPIIYEPTDDEFNGLADLYLRKQQSL